MPTPRADDPGFGRLNLPKESEIRGYIALNYLEHNMQTAVEVDEFADDKDRLQDSMKLKDRCKDGHSY